MKPALSTMIRVGSSTSFSSQFNSFHSTSTQTSGFYTNASQTSPPSGNDVVWFGVSTIIPPFPAGVKDLNLALYRSTTGAPVTVSDTYISITKVSGGFQIARANGFSAVILTDLALDGSGFSYGLGMLDRDVSYIRVGNVSPSPQTFSWKSTASGTNPRTVYGFESDKIDFYFNGSGMKYTPLDPSRSLRIIILTYDSTDLVVETLSGDPGQGLVVVGYQTYSDWSGSSLGATVARVIIGMTQ